MFLACAIQTLIASFTKTTKEAGTYLPGLALAFLLINQFLSAEPILVSNVAISAFLTILLAVVVTWLGIRLYQGERIIGG